MGKSKNLFDEIDSNGNISRVLAKEYRNNNNNDLKNIVIKNFENVVFEDKHIFSHNVKGKNIKSLLLRVVGTGVKGQFNKKRIQVFHKFFSSFPDDIISIYKFNDNVIFIRLTNNETLNNLPQNITNLFFVNIKQLQRAMNESFDITKKYRGNETKIIFSKKVSNLYSEKEIKKIKLSDFDDKKDYEEIKNYTRDSINSINSAIVGRIGEEIIHKLIKIKSKILSQINDIENYKWVNEEKEMFTSYDFLNKKSYDVLEVKSSEDSKSQNFILSNAEKIKLFNSPKKYWLIKVNGVNITKKTYKNIKIYNGIDLIRKKFREIKTYVVNEGESNEK